MKIQINSSITSTGKPTIECKTELQSEDLNSSTELLLDKAVKLYEETERIMLKKYLALKQRME